MFAAAPPMPASWLCPQPSDVVLSSDDDRVSSGVVTPKSFLTDGAGSEPFGAASTANDVPAAQPYGARQPDIASEDDLFKEMFAGSSVGTKVHVESSRDEMEELLEKEEANLGLLISARQDMDTGMQLGGQKLDSTDAEQVLLANAAETGFDLKCAIGQTFSNTAGKTAEYKALKGTIGSRQKQAQFRIDWAAKKLQECIEQKSHSQSWRRVDVAKGVYRPFSMIWKKEGGDRSAWTGALKLVAKSIKMGGSWVRKNEQTERWEFLHMQHSTSDIFEEAWSKCRTWSSSSGELGGANVAAATAIAGAAPTAAAPGTTAVLAATDVGQTGAAVQGTVSKGKG